MKDFEHLEWIFERLVEVYDENPNYDYMIRFKKIIQKTKEQEDGLTNQEKMDFILDTQTRIMSAIFKGHKSTDKDEFQKDREKMIKYRKELGLI